MEQLKRIWLTLAAGCLLSGCMSPLQVAENTSDENKLALLALKNPDPLVRKAACSRTKDQAIVATAATTDPDPTVRLAAVKSLTGAMLKTRTNEMRLQDAPMPLIPDQRIMSRLALCDSDQEIRHAAITNVFDQTVLARIATEDRDLGARQAALKRLGDMKLLLRLANPTGDLHSIYNAPMLGAHNLLQVTPLNAPNLRSDVVPDMNTTCRSCAPLS